MPSRGATNMLYRAPLPDCVWRRCLPPCRSIARIRLPWLRSISTNRGIVDWTLNWSGSPV